MQYCTRCLYPGNHPLGITFDDQGVCSGCRVHEEKDVLDWEERSQRLVKIFDAFRSRSGRNYDCIIPVSGARDSHFIVHTVRHVYKMRPLLVTYNKHYNTQLGIRNLAYLRSLIGADILTSTISPQTVKKMTRISLKKLASMYWHCIVGQAVFPVQTAVRFKVPLIVWGAHQGCDQVGMYSHLDEVEMTRRYRKDHDFMGMEAEDLIQGEDIDDRDVKPFCYPHDKELESVGVRGIFLSNYIRWDTKRQHEDMLKIYKYETALQHRTFDTYNDVDCFHYSDLHDYIKFLKWGYGKATDHACREIRLKRLTREEGIDLVEKYQNKLPDPESLALFLNWLGIKKEELFDDIDARRDPRVWKKRSDGQWQLLDSVINHRRDSGIDSVRLTKKEDCEFSITPSKDPWIKDDQYVLVGRGWVD
ncbi:MAG: N-acetyl sugar amidotransferase [Candidatus Omnitrophica bacterium]|nr:N-acetyl sugar amidotransferase [Candidatus Omnitrophota bacterium]